MPIYSICSWFNASKYTSFKLMCTPTQHFRPVGPAFKEIGELFSGFDLVTIPTGAYKLSWFTLTTHCGPSG
ncbi:hypothetical protein EDD85DRAFT_957388 [Armillaria nabsnona]|nr:hypothetical protein EDD85DRAFT_957388 [Armillaria nabsnona]